MPEPKPAHKRLVHSLGKRRRRAGSSMHGWVLPMRTGARSIIPDDGVLPTIRPDPAGEFPEMVGWSAETEVNSPPAQGWDQQSELEIVPPSASPPGGMHVKRGA